jgi:CDP-glucose 4,6-dehydratase
MFSDYRGKKVFITGHTGFKGSWLTSWLISMGAEVTGYSQNILPGINHYALLKPDVKNYFNDIRDLTSLRKAIRETSPDIVFHLAAQPLVRYSYHNPIETFETNIMGTAHLLEACRGIESIKGIIIVTTDKCYENKEWFYSYRENDALGGYDPYSASKAGAEIVVESYRNSFFASEQFGQTHQTLIATARAGNVIGGGDWSTDRLIPDAIRAAVSGQTLQLRYPGATRPWQHVLEPLSGYLLLGKKLLAGEIEYAEAWNFGPSLPSNQSVLSVLEASRSIWDKISFEQDETTTHPHEAGLLMLDSSKAYHQLGWQPKWGFSASITKTIEWYQQYYENHQLLTHKQIRMYDETI